MTRIAERVIDLHKTGAEIHTDSFGEFGKRFEIHLCVAEIPRNRNTLLHQRIADTFSAVFCGDIKFYKFHAAIGQSVRRKNSAASHNCSAVLGDPICAPRRLKQ